MSQHPPHGDLSDPSAYPYPYPCPYPQPVGFDPADPLVSNDFNGWWRRSFHLVRAAWRPMAVIQAIVAVPILVLLLPAMLTFQDKQREAQQTIQAAIDAGDRPDFSLFFAGLPALLPAAAVAG